MVITCFNAAFSFYFNASFLKHKQKRLTNMNSRGVRDSLIKKLTILIFLYFNFFKLHYLENYTEGFLQSIIPLSKHLNNITNH